MGLEQLEGLLQGLQSFDAHEEMLAIVENNGKRIVELQQEQLAAGVDNTGALRVDGYRPLTIYLKKKFGEGLGAETGHVTFFMTGELYGSLQTEVTGDEFQVKSPLFTYDKMISRVGEENYGLDPDQRMSFATEITLPEFGRALAEKTGLIL